MHENFGRIDTDGSNSREDRQEACKRSWGFDCSCSLCTQSDVFVHESDRRLELIAELESYLNDWSEDSIATPEMADTLLSLYEQERLYTQIEGAYVYAALAYNAVGKQYTAIKHAALAVEFGMVSSGPKDRHVLSMRRLMMDPESHWSWMRRGKTAEPTPDAPPVSSMTHSESFQGKSTLKGPFLDSLRMVWRSTVLLLS
jgi:hypothetical protein